MVLLPLLSVCLGLALAMPSDPLPGLKFRRTRGCVSGSAPCVGPGVSYWASRAAGDSWLERSMEASMLRGPLSGLLTRDPSSQPGRVAVSRGLRCTPSPVFLEAVLAPPTSGGRVGWKRILALGPAPAFLAERIGFGTSERRGGMWLSVYMLEDGSPAPPTAASHKLPTCWT